MCVGLQGCLCEEIPEAALVSELTDSRASLWLAKGVLICSVGSW